MPTTSKSESQTNIEKLLGLGMTQEQLSGEKYGRKMSGGEMQTFITKYGLSQPSSLAMAVNSNQVADQASVSGAAGVATRATATDLLSQFGGSGDISSLKMPTFNYEQAYQDLLSSSNITPLEAQLNQLKTDELTAYNQFQVNKRGEEGKGGLTPINVVEGRIGEHQKTAQDKLATIAPLKQSVSDELNTKYSSINKLMELKGLNYTTALNMYGEAKATHDKIESIQLQFPGAEIAITDSTDVIAGKIQKNNEKEAIKTLYMSTFGSSGKGMSTKEMEKKLKKRYKSEKEYEKQKRKLELESAQEDIGYKKALSAKALKGGSGKKATKQDKYEEGIAGFEEIFESVKGSDGFVDPKDYNKARTQWKKNGLTTADFDELFEGYRNPYDSGYKVKKSSGSSWGG